jgi:hypothetical protein
MMSSILKNFEERSIAFLDRKLGFPRERNRFLKAHGYPLNLEDPQSFNEKICYKKIYDRNPLLPIVADKYAVRDYLVKTLGPARAEPLLIPLLDHANHPNQLNLPKLPANCVIKSNHGSGNNIIIRNGVKPGIPTLTKTLIRWIREPYGLRNHEWAYTQMPRKILVEQLLLDSNANIPADYKMHIIHGKCAFTKVDNDRHNNFTSTLYDRDWNFLNVKWRRTIGEVQPKPIVYERMLELAEELAKPFDFIRIDFYVLDERIYFSEMTHYPSRGRGPFEPRDFDFKIGKLWRLDFKA